MSTPQNPFVVEQLRPVNPNGQSTATYELSRASVSPTRVVGRDARGFPVEDTLPTVFWKWFLMLDGCLNKVPLRTGSVFSMHADATAYEEETMRDLITQGCIPAWLCPYSTRYQHWTGGAFAEVPAGEHDCGGSEREGGCEHLKKIAKARQEAQLKKTRDFEAQAQRAKEEEILKLRDGIVQGIGEVLRQPASQAQRKQNLRDGKTEE